MNPRILVVEDEDKISDLLRRGLSYEGYRVDVARDGQTGLNLARDNPPDLVILDWMLPGMDGLEVCRRLRSGGLCPSSSSPRATPSPIESSGSTLAPTIT